MSTDTATPLHSTSGASLAEGVSAFLSGTCESVRQLLTREPCGPLADQGHRKTISIHMFPDKVLLEIFDSCRIRKRKYLYGHQMASILDWKLVHVCQRWRDLIFASSSRLDLELFCSCGTPVGKDLGRWPGFPIVMV